MIKHASNENEKGKSICYLMISHGMMVEQIGNLLDNSQNLDFSSEATECRFPRPDNEINKADKEVLLDKIKGMDWTGIPKINYMCMNSYVIKTDQEGKEFTDFKVIHKLSN